ncbi:hypothetical protein [Streptomyces sp. NPDC007346]|uniref:hypothetical protein n=1 Tax=Streptomyces sp. NPDC007346 TaxID=3154682 RepID=UPI003454EC31
MTPQPPPGQPGLPAGPADEELFRDALHRTAGTLPPLPDLVPDAVREGQSRRSRNRGLAVAGTFVAVTAVTLASPCWDPWCDRHPTPSPPRLPAPP